MIDTFVAFVDDQVSVELPPTLIVLGDAVNDVIAGSGLTVTSVVSVAVPPAPVAVAVYVVVLVGETSSDPDVATEPTP